MRKNIDYDLYLTLAVLIDLMTNRFRAQSCFNSNDVAATCLCIDCAVARWEYRFFHLEVFAIGSKYKGRKENENKHVCQVRCLFVDHDRHKCKFHPRKITVQAKHEHPDQAKVCWSYLLFGIVFPRDSLLQRFQQKRLDMIENTRFVSTRSIFYLLHLLFSGFEQGNLVILILEKHVRNLRLLQCCGRFEQEASSCRQPVWL